jgi:crossover junction endodeoxyribonuclease RusA
MTAADELGLPPLTPPGLLLDIFAAGNPAAQGSKRHVGSGRMVEMNKRLPGWRTLIAWQAAQQWTGAPLDHAVTMELEFVMPRPKGLPKSKPTPAHTKRVGDLDKLCRGVFDALTHVVLADDALVTRLVAERRYAEVDEQPGARIRVSAA